MPLRQARRQNTGLYSIHGPIFYPWIHTVGVTCEGYCRPHVGISLRATCPAGGTKPAINFICARFKLVKNTTSAPDVQQTVDLLLAKHSTLFNTQRTSTRRNTLSSLADRPSTVGARDDLLPPDWPRQWISKTVRNQIQLSHENVNLLLFGIHDKMANVTSHSAALNFSNPTNYKRNKIMTSLMTVARKLDRLHACVSFVSTDLFWHSASLHITSHHITSNHITSHHIKSHHITSNHITSHHFTSYHIIHITEEDDVFDFSNLSCINLPFFCRQLSVEATADACLTPLVCDFLTNSSTTNKSHISKANKLVVIPTYECGMRRFQNSQYANCNDTPLANTNDIQVSLCSYLRSLKRLKHV
jgi:hypothetical protein